MAFDGDLVRVDLLKIKRKLYISYPEGSKERQDFLIASKLSELTYLQKLVEPDQVVMVFEEYARQLKNEVINFILCLGLGLSFTFLMLGFHQLHPTNFFLLFWRMPGFIGIGFAMSHIMHAIDNWQAFQPFKTEYATLREKIEKLTQDLKGLGR
jgi:hypothetical protein